MTVDPWVYVGQLAYLGLVFAPFFLFFRWVQRDAERVAASKRRR